jgi:GTPase SAR1 family protein
MLAYDITNEKSFENIKGWMRNIEQHATDDVEKMILANKCDMTDKRVITTDQGAKVRLLMRQLPLSLSLVSLSCLCLSFVCYLPRCMSACMPMLAHESAQARVLDY